MTDAEVVRAAQDELSVWAAHYGATHLLMKAGESHCYPGTATDVVPGVDVIMRLGQTMPLSREQLRAVRMWVADTREGQLPLHQQHTKLVDRLQRRHPGTRRQRSFHGAGRYSVQFFDRTTGRLVADYDLPEVV